MQLTKPKSKLVSQEPGTLTAPCALCHQSKYVDSLTGRCTHCQPIRMNDIQPELQRYARRAQLQRYKELAIGVIAGPAVILIYLFYTTRGKSAPIVLWIGVILTPTLIRKGCIHLFSKGEFIGAITIASAQSSAM